MANLAGILKEEIARQARKELRGETESLKKASSRYRSDIAALKRQVASLEQNVVRLEKLIARTAPAAHTEKTSTPVRFRADGLKKHRERLGLSAAALGAILGVSAQTIYNWEAGTTRPSKPQVGKIAILRQMGKREVLQRMAQMNAT